jgi:NitT/TauT family transport system substrate-binding protein
VNDQSTLSKIRISIFSFVVVCILSGAGCSRRDKDVEPVTLRIGYQDNVASALLLIAHEQGYLTDEGIEAELTPYPSGKLALKAMLSGDVDLATCADIPIAIHAPTHPDLRILTTIATTDEGAWIIARRDKGIYVPADLAGKRIGTQQGSAVHYFLSMFLLFHEIPEKDTDITFMPATNLAPALIENRIDAFSMRNPFIAHAKAELGDRAIELFDPDVYLQHFCLVTRQASCREQGSGMIRLVRALKRAETTLYEDPESARMALISAFGPQRTEEVNRDYNRYTTKIGLTEMLAATLKTQMHWAQRNAGVTNRAQVDTRKLLCTAPLGQVEPEAITLAVWE